MDAITALPSTAGDVDYETGGSEEFFGGEGGDSEEEPLDIGGKWIPWTKEWFLWKLLLQQSIYTKLNKQTCFQNWWLHTSSSTQLADNKKGEKESSRSEGEQKVLNIQVSKAIMPIFAFIKPPAKDSIDLINEAPATLRAAEKKQFSPINWEKIDEDIQKKFGLEKKPE
ncbi:hypothetical protein AgCh_009811 [Apium graveolens]